MPGLDLPIKLRRLGAGKVLTAEQVTEMLAPFDKDTDGAITRDELTTFLVKHRVGGPWFCQVLSKTLWQIAQDRWGTEVTSIATSALGRIMAFSMARPGRPAKRYVLTPDAVRGLEPKKDPEGNLVMSGSGPLTSSPRSAPRAQGRQTTSAPRASEPRRASGRSRSSGRPSRSGPRRPGPKPRR